ncbi:glycosyltransferase [Thermodesulfobacteriota bacterium]
MLRQRECRYRNIGFISTRIAGTDGVSLEIEKWAAVLERNDFTCFYFSGENDRPPEKCMLVEEAHFFHPEIQEINDLVYGRRVRPQELTRKIHQLRDYLKQKIYEFVKHFEIDLIIPENALAIPLNIPLGLALVEYIAETGIPTLAHHHDFSWERTRFLVNAVEDFLAYAFPPNLPTMQHAVINSLASEQLSHRRGISNSIIPNVYDFATPPPPFKNCSEELRREVGLGREDLFILQPTRVVPRKWIERSLEIVRLMELERPVLIISHSAEDEGDLYNQRIQEYAARLGVELISIEHLVKENANSGGNNSKFSIGDVYQCADLVSYPSGYEGFGNAFIETIYYRKPIIVNRYSIYVADIEPLGFDVIPIEGFVTGETIKKVFEVLNDGKRLQEMTDRNYQLGNRYFSYEVLERALLHLIDVLETQCGG